MASPRVRPGTIAGSRTISMAAVVNWLKHTSCQHGCQITELEVVTTIIRGIQKFVGTYETTHVKFQSFSEWCIQKGYTKKPLAEPKK